MMRPAYALIAAVVGICAGCMQDLELAEEDRSALAVGESRSIELRYMRLDVRDFEQTLTRDDLLAMPTAVTGRMWLLDLDLSNGPTSPRLIDNALSEISSIDPSELTPASRNMQRLIDMTPENSDLTGTVLEPMSELGAVVGLSSARVLGDMMGREVDASFLPVDAIADTIVEQVVRSHPRAQTRRGPVTAEHPDGIYLVTEGAIPVTLGDALNNFATLSETFGPAFVDGVLHPGFVVGDTRSVVLGDDFALTVRANANALPFKGVDLTNATRGSVNSLGGQIESIFDFDDPNWLTISGLPEEPPVIEELTFTLTEHDQFVFGGRSPHPDGFGDSDVWQLPPWTIERVLAGSARRAFVGRDHHAEYLLPGNDEPVFEVQVEDGWARFLTAGDIGDPPPPAYIWDVVLEIGQVRMHDEGIPEGDADVAFTVHDIEVGITASEVEQTVRENLETDPAAFLDLANIVFDASHGAPDFFYVRVPESASRDLAGDWLYFVEPTDIPLDDEGWPTRDYAYDRPGFFADANLTQRVSSRTLVVGDHAHEKVRIDAGDVLFVQDDDGATFRIAADDKPGQQTISLEVTRVR